MRIAPLLNCVIKPLGVHNNNRNDCSIHGAAGSKNFFLNSPSTDLFIKTNRPSPQLIVQHHLGILLT